MMAAKFASPPPPSTYFELTFPAPFVLLVTINRESAMNAIPIKGHWEGERIWQWFDEEPSLRVAIVTGKGSRAFSAGADLLEQRDQRKLKKAGEEQQPQTIPPGGFMGVSRRVGKKPVIAAVNGYALGGGFEIALNCDLVLASPTAQFGLPEARRGLFAAAGGLPRVVRIFGMQLAGEIVLAGRVLSAREAEHFGFSRTAKSQASLLQEALELAAKVAELSPDAVIVSRAGLREAWETASVERAAQLTSDRFSDALRKGENLLIGLQAFATKTQPKWVPSKL